MLKELDERTVTLLIRMRNYQSSFDNDRELWMEKHPTANDVGDENCGLATLNGKLSLCEDVIADLKGEGDSVVMSIYHELFDKKPKKKKEWLSHLTLTWWRVWIRLWDYKKNKDRLSVELLQLAFLYRDEYKSLTLVQIEVCEDGEGTDLRFFIMG